MNDRQLKELILAAKGKLPFDIYFYNARIVDVYRERIIDSGSVGTKNGIIAAVCPDFEPRATEFIDCRGMYLAPSFIDAHMHIESSKLTPLHTARAQCRTERAVYSLTLCRCRIHLVLRA